MKGKNVQRISAATNNQGSTVQCCITYGSDLDAQQSKNLFWATTAGTTPIYAGDDAGTKISAYATGGF